jgi:hypothetical protein
MIQDVLRMGTSGLNSHEQGLLAQQLKMLNGKTQAAWRYVGQDADVELMIVRDASSSPTQATAVLSNPQSGHAVRQQIEWPLRLFGLLDLLTDAEKRAVRHVTPTARLSLAARLAALESDASIDHNGLLITVSPAMEQVRSNRADFDALVDELASIPATVTFGAAAATATVHKYSLKRLLWALTLREPAGATPAGTLFKIRAWPNFSEWQSSPAYLRLAALYSRQYATVEQGVSFSDCTAAEVSAFLQACKFCALGLSSKAAPKAPQQPVQRPTDSQPSSLLQRLRSRLGLSFRKG